MQARFAGQLARSKKRSRGKTPVEATPIAIRSDVPISPKLDARIRSTMARRIGHAAPLVERGTVRFEDINGPRGGVDTVCRIKLVLGGRPSVQASERAHDPGPAFDLASHKVARALERVRGKHGLTSGRGAGVKGGRPRRTRHGAPAAVETRADNPPPRALPRLETARLPPARKKAKVKARARTAKHRTGTQRGRG
jgi:hypothetical protein